MNPNHLNNLHKDNIEDFYNIHEFEIQLMESIVNSKITETKELFEGFFKKDFIYNVSYGDELQYIKNYIISLNFIICHQIILKGVSPYGARAKYISFSNLIQNSTSKDQVLEIAMVFIEGSIEQLKKNTHNIDNIYIKNAINYIKHNLEEDLTLEMVAEHVNLSKCYFCSQFKKELNMSFTDYLSYLRVEKSKYLLTHTKKTILDIAFSVGFNSQSYFTTQFKKFTSVSPKEYRNGNSIFKNI